MTTLKASNYKTFLICFLTLFLFIKTTFAQEVISWQQSVDLAIKNNNNLRAAIENEKATKYQKNATVSGFLPQATASLSTQRTNNVDENYDGVISVNQNLFNGFSDVGKFDQAKANNLISKAYINIVKAQVSYDLKSAYQNFIYAKETVTLLDEIIKRREDNLQIIDLRFKSGMENKGSLLLAKAYLEQAKYDRLQARNLIETARAQVCRAIGMNKCTEFDVENAVPITDPQNEAIDFEAIIESTPEHIQAKAQEDAAAAGILIAKSEFFPDLDVRASTGRNGNKFFPEDDYWSVGMTLSIPFFTGGRDYYSTLSAHAKNEAAKENRQNVDQQLLVNLKQKYNSYIESVTKLRVDENFQKAAQLRAEIGRKKYNNGLLNFEEWDLIETDLINREKSYLQSKLNRVINEAGFEQAQGKGVFYGY